MDGGETLAGGRGGVYENSLADTLSYSQVTQVNRALSLHSVGALLCSLVCDRACDSHCGSGLEAV